MTDRIADTEARLVDVAERVLALVDDGAEAQVVVHAGEQALTRFAGSFIHQNVAESGVTVTLLTSYDGQVATAGADQVDDEALRSLVRRAAEAARLRPADPDWPGLAGPAPVPALEAYDEATAAASAAERAGVVRGFVDAAGGLETAGFCSSTSVVAAYANTAGQRATGRVTAAAVNGVARTGRSDGAGRGLAVRLSDLDGAALGAVAAGTARSSVDAEDLEPGTYEVVLEPSCVGDILLFLDLDGFNGRAVNEQRSFVRVGERQFDERISLRDDATDPRLPALPFDAEGTPRRPLDLVTAGVTTGVLHDRRTARRAGGGVASTGHAVPGGETEGAFGTNLYLAPGEGGRDDLVRQVERGLLVSDFWYTRVLDPRTQVVTGLTRNGVFLIEDGAVTRPVTNMRFTQSYLDALGPGNVLAVGADLSTLELDLDFFTVCVPSVRLRSWHFTGGAKG